MRARRAWCGCRETRSRDGVSARLRRTLLDLTTGEGRTVVLLAWEESCCSFDARLG